METTPKIYWICVIVGMVAGACVGWATRYSDMHAALAHQQALLVKSGKWTPAQAKSEMSKLQALAMDARRRHQAENKPDSPEGKLVAHVLDAHVDGMDDVDLITAPYRDYKDQALPVALVFSLPGFLLGLGVAVVLDHRKTKAAAPRPRETTT